MVCGEVLAACLFLGAALCVHMFLLLVSGAHRLMGSVWKIRIVLFVYVSVGTVPAHDIGHPCLACCVPCARFDGWLNVSACCSPSLLDGCQAPPVERDDNISVECSCKETLDSPRHALLDGFWSVVGAILAFGGCCILFFVAKLMACTGLAKRSPGQEVSKTRQALVHSPFPSGGVMLRWPGCSSARRGEFCLSAAHGANVMNCDVVLKGSFSAGIAMDLSVLNPCPVDSYADIDMGCLLNWTLGICISAGAAAAAAFDWKFPLFPWVTILSSCTVL